MVSHPFNKVIISMDRILQHSLGLFVVALSKSNTAQDDSVLWILEDSPHILKAYFWEKSRTLGDRHVKLDLYMEGLFYKLLKAAKCRLSPPPEIIPFHFRVSLPFSSSEKRSIVPAESKKIMEEFFQEIGEDRLRLDIKKEVAEKCGLRLEKVGELYHRHSKKLRSQAKEKPLEPVVEAELQQERDKHPEKPTKDVIDRVCAKFEGRASRSQVMRAFSRIPKALKEARKHQRKMTARQKKLEREEAKERLKEEEKEQQRAMRRKGSK